MFVKGQGVSLGFINHGGFFPFASGWRALRLVDIVSS
jgi:hypothetical protein